MLLSSFILLLSFGKFSHQIFISDLSRDVCVTDQIIINDFLFNYFSFIKIFGYDKTTSSANSTAAISNNESFNCYLNIIINIYEWFGKLSLFKVSLSPPSPSSSTYSAIFSVCI
jgi:hypothetical protein